MDSFPDLAKGTFSELVLELVVFSYHFVFLHIKIVIKTRFNLVLYKSLV